MYWKIMYWKIYILSKGEIKCIYTIQFQWNGTKCSMAIKKGYERFEHLVECHCHKIIYLSNNALPHVIII